MKIYISLFLISLCKNLISYFKFNFLLCEASTVVIGVLPFFNVTPPAGWPENETINQTAAFQHKKVI